jgi:AcrR family transcriptional regulator
MLADPAVKTSSDDTHARILAAARELFATRGTRGTTTREVADRAGVNEATVFRHFGTKQALLRAMLDQYCESRDQMRDAIESMQGTLEEQLCALGLMSLEGIKRKEDLIRVGLAEQVTDPDGSAMTWRAPIGALSLLTEYMQKKIDAAELRGDAEMLARTFMSFWFSYVLGSRIWNLPDGPADRRRFVGRCVDLFLNGARMP